MRVAAVARMRARVCVLRCGMGTLPATSMMVLYTEKRVALRAYVEEVAAAEGFLRRAREMCVARKRRGTALQDCTGSAVRPGEHRSTRRARARDWLPAEGGDGEISRSEQDHVR